MKFLWRMPRSVEYVLARKALWTGISDALESDIAAGRYRPGVKLPTEAQLAARFSVNRHTVRRALASLADRGFVSSRRGAGVFVTHAQTDYPIGSRVRFHQNILAAGRTPQRKVLLLQTRASDSKEASALDLELGASVHVCEGLSLVDGEPLAVFQSIFPAQRFPKLLGNLRENSSVTAALKSEGIQDFIRRETRIDGKLASVTLATQLRIQVSSPVLRTIGINVDEKGRPIEYGRTWFAAERTTLVLSSGSNH
ncbi:MAG: phosphonate metabolism transcriptional regulator PhnF [Pseudomonadota bacterium]